MSVYEVLDTRKIITKLISEYYKVNIKLTMLFQCYKRRNMNRISIFVNFYKEFIVINVFRNKIK